MKRGFPGERERERTEERDTVQQETVNKSDGRRINI